MKILFIGDGSGYHANLAGALRRMGHDVTLASDGTRWMDTRRDIDLRRRPGKLSGALLWLRLSTLRAADFRGYDVVQLSAPTFLPLRPDRNRTMFDRLRRDNGKVFLSALGTDNVYIRSCIDNPVLKYSEWSLGGEPTPWSLTPESEKAQWLDPHLEDYTRYFYDHIDGAVSALYEYHRIVSRVYPDLPLAYGGIPIDTAALPQHRQHADGPLRVLFAAHKGREAEKGADVILDMLRRLERECPGKIAVDTPENVPYSQFLNRLASYDIVSDQLYSYTPATTALLAMAMGVVPLSGAEPEYYKFIGENDLRPIFNLDPLDPDGTYAQLKLLINNRQELARMSREGVDFVARHNEASIVARRFLDFYESF